MAAKVLAHVKANPGHRLQEIGAALKVPTSDLKRPVATLLDEKNVRTTGNARGTKYFARGGGRKASKKKDSQEP
jgi:DNA-binding IclR family transcriptional regulator